MKSINLWFDIMRMERSRKAHQLDVHCGAMLETNGAIFLYFCVFICLRNCHLLCHLCLPRIDSSKALQILFAPSPSIDKWISVCVCRLINISCHFVFEFQMNEKCFQAQGTVAIILRMRKHGRGEIRVLGEWEGSLWQSEYLSESFSANKNNDRRIRIVKGSELNI